jgi:hypothetical protein
MASARLYRRTEAGKAAWQRQDARVPLEYRRVLGLIETDTHPDSLRARLARYSEAETLHLLDELVDLVAAARDYSIVSVARSRIVGGMATPSALAVLRFRTSSNSVGHSMGKSLGKAPLRILPA